jgi:hypothetical protein
VFVPGKPFQQGDQKIEKKIAHSLDKVAKKQSPDQKMPNYFHQNAM